nr:damage-inducible protein CinA [bacterium]
MSELNIELISIGDEILIGQTLDTNSNWIAAWLSGAGFRLRWHSVIGDNKSDIRHQVRRALDRADVVITTGGLGPTADDITRPILTKLFKDDLLVRKDLLKMIRDRFSARK